MTQRLKPARFRPAKLNAATDGFIVNPGTAAGFRENHSLTAEIHYPILACICGLLKSGSPSAITRRVISIVVSAVKACSLGPLSHIAQECHEVISPSSADGNTATAIVGVATVIKVVAAPLHPFPNSIFRYFISMSMFKICLARQLSMQAAATPAYAGTQVRRLDGPLCSAHANTEPVASVYSIQYSPSTEFHPGEFQCC